MRQAVAVHAVLRLEMADHRLDSGAAPELPPNGLRHPAPLAGGEDLEPVIRPQPVAAIAVIDVNPLQPRARELLDLGQHRAQGVAVIGLSRQRLDVGHELPAPAAPPRRGHRHLHAKFPRLVRLTLADALHLRRVQRIIPAVFVIDFSMLALSF